MIKRGCDNIGMAKFIDEISYKFHEIRWNVKIRNNCI